MILSSRRACIVALFLTSALRASAVAHAQVDILMQHNDNERSGANR